jgi:hypothetical protein
MSKEDRPKSDEGVLIGRRSLIGGVGLGVAGAAVAALGPTQTSAQEPVALPGALLVYGLINDAVPATNPDFLSQVPFNFGLSVSRTQTGVFVFTLPPRFSNRPPPIVLVTSTGVSGDGQGRMTFGQVRAHADRSFRIETYNVPTSTLTNVSFHFAVFSGDGRP